MKYMRCLKIWTGRLQWDDQLLKDFAAAADVFTPDNSFNSSKDNSRVKDVLGVALYAVCCVEGHFYLFTCLLYLSLAFMCFLLIYLMHYWTDRTNNTATLETFNQHKK